MIIETNPNRLWTNEILKENLKSRYTGKIFNYKKRIFYSNFKVKDIKKVLEENKTKFNLIEIEGKWKIKQTEDPIIIESKSETEEKSILDFDPYKIDPKSLKDLILVVFQQDKTKFWEINEIKKEIIKITNIGYSVRSINEFLNENKIQNQFEEKNGKWRCNDVKREPQEVLIESSDEDLELIL